MKTAKTALWTCPECNRQFERKGQSHSCHLFPVEKHFEGKPAGKLLYNQLKRAVKKQTGAFKTESLECCIHFVSTFTFAAVKIFRDKIKVDFSLNRKIQNGRIARVTRMSAHNWLYIINVFHENEIDTQLLGWIQEAHDRKKLAHPVT